MAKDDQIPSAIDKMLIVNTPGHTAWCTCNTCYVNALRNGSASEQGVGLPNRDKAKE